MFEFVNNIAQKGGEYICGSVLNQCSNVLLERLTCLLTDNTITYCLDTEAVNHCFSVFQDCSSVWLNQYALPIGIGIVVGTLGTLATVNCCFRISPM